MKQRVAQMERVLGVRALRERICEAANARAAGEVRVAERALDQAQTAGVAAGEAARQAMAQGDRVGWLLADAMREVAGWNRAQLTMLRAARIAEAEVLATALRVSQAEREGVEKILADMQTTLQREAERGAQMRSDDLFLSRVRKPRGMKRS